MTLEEIENSLPNGLHDAEVHRLIVDYSQRKLTVEVAVWVGNLDGPREMHEAYRGGRLEIRGSDLRDHGTARCKVPIRQFEAIDH